MTVPPPPAVPGELIEKAAKALQCFEYVPAWTEAHPPEFRHYQQARAVLAAVYGDIVEAAQKAYRASGRDRADAAVRRAMERASAERDRAVEAARRDALDEAIARYDAEHEGPPGRARAILTDLRSAP